MHISRGQVLNAVGLVAAGGLVYGTVKLVTGGLALEKSADSWMHDFDADHSGDIGLGRNGAPDERTNDTWVDCRAPLAPSGKRSERTTIDGGATFEHADRLGNDDGRTTRDELLAVLRTYDTDGNGRLSLGESRAADEVDPWSSSNGCARA